MTPLNLTQEVGVIILIAVAIGGFMQLSAWMRHRLLKMYVYQQTPAQSKTFTPKPTFYTSALNGPTDEPTDALFDGPRNLAALFGNRTRELMRTRATEGQVFEAARLAASYAFLADPALKPAKEWQPAPQAKPLLYFVSTRVH